MSKPNKEELNDIPKPLRKYFESGLLRPEVHLRLVGDIQTIASAAGIPPISIYTPASDHCSQDEIDWLVDYKHLEIGESGGLLYTGDCTDVGVRLFTMAGALIRNFISPRFMTVQEVIEVYKKGGEVEAAVLLIPNFYLGKKSGGDIPSWQTSMLMGMLLSRYAKGKKTIMYVEDVNAMEGDYGSAFASHLTCHFKQITE